MLSIVDFGMGNLRSVQLACEHVGAPAEITADPARLTASAGLILPGVGAFGDAMRTLDAGGLSEAIRSFAASGRPLLGICLGLQLLFESSDEGGEHRGLGLVPGQVRRLQVDAKVPNVGWLPVSPSRSWEGSLLTGVPAGHHFYFVHSYVAQPSPADAPLCQSRYGGQEFVSGIQSENLTAFQFHPERSGPWGLHVYANFARAAAAFN